MYEHRRSDILRQRPEEHIVVQALWRTLRQFGNGTTLWHTSCEGIVIPSTISLSLLLRAQAHFSKVDISGRE